MGVAVFAVRDGAFLMGRRHGAHGAGTWSLPGGHLEFGESFADAARRELLEETGLTIGDPELLAVTNDVFARDGRHSVTLWMVGDEVGGEPAVHEPDKFTDHGWYNLDTLPRPLFQPWRQLLTMPALGRLDAILRADR
ncbi:NUDIX hydrolase [Actinoplanes sp. NPDC049668]|uniref:nucleotide triphosphate diphosphatase NUDT15 n=1 Tax=unclassified Actinoplanes TaxID=2626549 RepID=UPI0033B80361